MVGLNKYYINLKKKNHLLNFLIAASVGLLVGKMKA